MKQFRSGLGHTWGLVCFALLVLLLAPLAFANPPIREDFDQPKTTFAQLKPGKDKFVFSNWSGPDIRVWSYIPTKLSPTDLPIVLVMHGVNRDAKRYRDQWAELAEENGLVIIVPEFSKHQFQGAKGYNLGGNLLIQNLADSKNTSPSAFLALEPLFDMVVGLLQSSQTQYTLYGHSAGAQFVHRFLFHQPTARVKRYLVANAGWYTLADYSEKYPYGLLETQVRPETLKLALQRDVIILLGAKDNNPNHKHLRRTPEAERQGAHRFARGIHFLRNAQAQATALDVTLHWKLGVVANAGHSNSQMAIGAATLID